MEVKLGVAYTENLYYRPIFSLNLKLFENKKCI